MKIYNTLTKSVTEFKPLDNELVGVYSCGPTVYARVHIGNLLSFIVADTLRRALQIAGYKTKHIMNITDIDDKTIQASKVEFPDLEPMLALKSLTSKYEEIFFSDLTSIGVDVGEIKFIRATDYIEPMQQLIDKLLTKEIAYVADDGIYFSIQQYKARGYQYGVLSKLDDKSLSKQRITNDEYDKDNIHDFSLWKKAKPGEPSWEYRTPDTVMDGRPGWHIECSAMSTSNLGQPFDIHTGGIDLIFPHHENEIAQSKGAYDKDLANYFVHNEHLLVEGKKMSKSLGNFLTLEDIKQKKYDPLAFRLLALQNRYRHQLNFTYEGLKSASQFLVNLQNFASLRYQPTKSSSESLNFVQARENISKHLLDDLKTPQGLSVLANIASETSEKGISDSNLDEFDGFLDFIDQAFGLRLKQTKNIDKSHYELIEKRKYFRKKGDYDHADRVRQQLADQSIGLKDVGDDTIWFRMPRR